ncbi:MAG: protease pro-enzyme activation domain-containing protein [Thermoplasmata archaeon]
MNGRSEPRRNLWRVVEALLLAGLMLASVGYAIGSPSASTAGTTTAPAGTGVGLPISTLLAAPRSTVSALLGGPSTNESGAAYSGAISALVAFPFSNSSELANFLAAVQDPSSPSYHHYLSASAFDEEFAASSGTYADAQIYFGSFPGISLTTFADRSALLLQGPSQVIASAFGVQLDEFSSPGRGTYYGPTGTPSLPQPIARGVTQIIGLSNYLDLESTIATVGPVLPSTAPTSVNGYPAPIESGGVQYLYGSDLQVAYDEESLFNVAYPTGEVVAAILWAGCSVSVPSGSPCPTDDLTAPFDPSDVDSYFNATIPLGQPHSTVYGVPFDGAPAPGPSAALDVTNAVLENTLDLDMVGSTAPGSTVYNVYGTASSSAETDAAMAYILNPTSTPGLRNVSVVSNSWGGSDRADASWASSMEEAAARGITVLAASGDAGDNPLSGEWSGTNAEFPSTVAANSYGVIGVGGTTLVVNTTSGGSYLHIASQTSWYDTDAPPGVNVLGSSGGTSPYYPEPTWQSSTQANSYIEVYATAGERGTPDVAAVANNTLITLQGASTPIEGTSIACPVTAGMVAEINAILERYDQGPVGFLDPAIYTWANEYLQQPTPETQPVGAVLVGSWRSILPSTPVEDVTTGANDANAAGPGYDLVTGWGSLDAYNFTTFLLNYNYTGRSFSLNGVQDILNLSGLAVTSVGGAYNASVQQNFFVANGLGAPIYWIQNVIYINATSAGWAVNYTGWAVLPFLRLYPSAAIYEYNFPIVGSTITTPITWTISSWLSGSNASRTMNYEVNGVTLSLPLPGAAYIIGGFNYQYYWQGAEYTNGPVAGAGVPGGLAPQFALVGGPTLGDGDFAAPTAGVLTANDQITGSDHFVPTAGASVLGLGADQTGETASNLLWSGGGSNWTVAYSADAVDQGIIMYSELNAGNPVSPGPQFDVNFTESGLAGGASWSVGVGSSTATCTVGTTGPSCFDSGTVLSIALANGSYRFSVADTAGYLPSPSSENLSVNGGPVNITIAFTAPPPGEYKVTFSIPSASVPPTPFEWTVVVSGNSSGPSKNPVIVFELHNGSYSFAVSGTQGYNASPASGAFNISGESVFISINFTNGGGGGGSNGSGFNLRGLCVLSVCGRTLAYVALSIITLCVAVAVVGVMLGRRSERRERSQSLHAPPNAALPPGAVPPAAAPPPMSQAPPPLTFAAAASLDAASRSDTAPERYCPACGGAITLSARYCRHCGTALPPARPG